MRPRTVPAVLAILAVFAALATPARAATETRRAIDALLGSGAIDQATHDRASNAYGGAIDALDDLRGTRRSELRGAIADIDAMAQDGELDAGSLPAALLTLERNIQWWTSKRPVPANGARVHVDGDHLVFQRYAHHGLQIQWLATFGKANSLWSQKRGEDLRALLDEAIGLAAPRADGIAWEYLFAFDGGRPPWVSGLAQGTALTALVRASSLLGDPRYLQTARAALGIFRAEPPAGIRVPTDAGAHYLQYSFAPRLRILNGFVQSLNGLADYVAAAPDDADAKTLLESGDAAALAELPSFDTGGWSRYSIPARDSSLHYHQVLADFLDARCRRGGAQAFCDFAARLRTDLVTPPEVTIVSRRARKRHATSVRVRLDKPATVWVKVTGPGKYRLLERTSMPSGTSGVGWRPPYTGEYAVEAKAIDPAGNQALTSRTVAVAK